MLAIAASENLSVRRVQQIVREQLDRRNANPNDFALLQIVRLERAISPAPRSDNRILHSGCYHPTMERGPPSPAAPSPNRKKPGLFWLGRGSAARSPWRWDHVRISSLGRRLLDAWIHLFRIIPFDWFSSLLRLCAGAVGLAPGAVSFGAGLGAWAKAAPATRMTPATIRQSRESMIRMRFKRIDGRTVPWGGREGRLENKAAGGRVCLTLDSFRQILYD
jgi:hypothetical protein